MLVKCPLSILSPLVKTKAGFVESSRKFSDLNLVDSDTVVLAISADGEVTLAVEFDSLMVHGADIASASTVDLDAATGDLVDITGTTTITAITLAEGRERTVRFTGALTLTHGASLVLPGSANITTVAGDMAIFRGYAAGVVRCVSYSPITVTGTGGAVKATSPTLVTPTVPDILHIGNGAAGVDSEIRWTGETSSANLFHMEDEGILNLRVGGASYFDYNAVGGAPQEQSGLTIDAICDSAARNITNAFAAWIKQSTAAITYGFFGGGYDEGASAVTGATYYGAAGYNYFTGTNARTLPLIVGVQGRNETILATNLTVTEALGGDFGSPYTGSGTGGSASRVVGIRASGSGGTANWAAIFSADVQMQTTSKLILGGSSTVKGINWFVRGSTTTNVLLAINSANEYDWRAASFAPVSGGTLKDLGLSTTQGWGSLYLQDTSASFTARVISTSATALTANRTLTVDMANTDRKVAFVEPRVVSMADATSFTPTVGTADLNTHTNTQAVGTLTANAPSGTPGDGQQITIRLKSTNVQTFSWNAIYRGCTTVALPTASTGGGKTDYFIFRYNATDTKWDIVTANYNY